METGLGTALQAFLPASRQDSSDLSQLKNESYYKFGIIIRQGANGFRDGHAFTRQGYEIYRPAVPQPEYPAEVSSRQKHSPAEQDRFKIILVGILGRNVEGLHQRMHDLYEQTGRTAECANDSNVSFTSHRKDKVRLSLPFNQTKN